MIERIRLKKFKNFEDAELILGPLTVLIGSNAAGKSNVQDAFRFLKGIGQRYTLAEIIGERYEGGLRQWPGIRGGVKEFDEIDTGIHPARLYLLLQLLEWRAFQDGVQILGMTHSPQVLRLLSEEALEYVSLIYRLTDVPQAKIQRIMSIPDIQRILETQDVARLHESGWFEDVMYFDVEPIG